VPTYVYCLVPRARAAPPAGLAGIDDEPVRLVSMRHADAWASTIASLPDSADRERRRALGTAHHAVVASALELGVTPIPVRAGQSFVDDTDCVHRLEARSDTDVALLERMAELVEMTSTFRLTTPAPVNKPDERAEDGGGEGRRHMEELRARDARVRELRDEALRAAAIISDRILPMARDTAVRVTGASGTGKAGVAVSHLIPRAEVEQYRMKLAGWLPPHFDGPLTVTGPFAPYSFVSNAQESSGD
jgi:hypothetical protein